MDPKALLAIVSMGAQEAALGVAKSLAERWQAHVTALHLTQLPEPAADPYGYSTDMWGAVAEEVRKSGEADRKLLGKRLQELGAPHALIHAEMVAALTAPTVAAQAIYADMVIVQQSTVSILRAAFESALFRSGRPVMLVPQRPRPTLGKRVLVAWAPKRESARALADADVFLQSAEAVRIVNIRPKRREDEDASPAKKAHDYLERRGVDAEVRDIADTGRYPEEILMDEARDFDADLLVMGGYGHARFQEFVFGGVTRLMTENAPIPVLMSH